MTAALLTIVSAGAASAQAPTGSGGGAGGSAPQSATDAAFEAAKRAFDALPETERRAIQDALVWTGDFNGVVNGSFGRATRAAIVAFAKRSNLAADGVLDQKGRDALFAAAGQTKTRVGFSTVRDPKTGATLGLPTKILVKRADTQMGSRWSAADNAVWLETMQSRESDGDLKALFDRLTAASPTRKVTYKFSSANPPFIVVTGEQGGHTFYTRVARGEVGGAGVLRGFTLSYPVSAKGNDRVAIAVANAFEPFARAATPTATGPGGAPAQPPGQTGVAPPPQPPAPRAVVVATGVAISADRVVTALGACNEPKIGSRPARVVARDAATNLTILEAQGLAARPAPMPTAAAAPDASVVVLYETSAGQGAGGAPLGAVMAASGELLATPARVLAPLQEQAPGGAIYDRQGGFLGLVGAGRAPTRVAGVVPQTAWPMIEAGKLAEFLAANGGRPATGGATAAKGAADIAAAARGSLHPVICTR